MRVPVLAGLLGGLLLSACVSTTPRIDASGPAHTESLQNWTASGRIGVSGGTQAGSGSFNWAQQASHSAVQLRGPLGSGALLIDYEAAQQSEAKLTLRASDGTQYNAEQALAEIETRMGVAVPVAELRYWLIGLAAPGSHEWRDGYALLQQAGWQVTYSEWLQQGALRLPTRLVLTRDQVRVLIRVQNWQVP